jgi:hypothetical protein
MRLARVPDCIYDYLFLRRILVAALAMVGGITQASAATISVSTPAELNKALASANPGNNNTFISNTFDLNTNGYGINVQKRTSDNKVCKSNSVINTSGGVTNISVTTDC